jgi:Icc-related predicted phosphoesterase
MSESKELKILCVADEIDLVVYSSSVKERFGDTDLILSAGDLPDEYLEFIVSMLNKPIISVAGNHDSSDTLVNSSLLGRNQAGLGRLSFAIRKEAGVRVLGIPGCMLYSGGSHQYSNASMAFRILALFPALAARRILKGRSVDIILAHSPPKGVGDGEDLPHRGFSIFPWLIRFAKPLYFIHGHVHLYDKGSPREFWIEGTKIINVYGHTIISLAMEKLR